VTLTQYRQAEQFFRADQLPFENDRSHRLFRSEARLCRPGYARQIRQHQFDKGRNGADSASRKDSRRRAGADLTGPCGKYPQLLNLPYRVPGTCVTGDMGLERPAPTPLEVWIPTQGSTVKFPRCPAVATSKARRMQRAGGTRKPASRSCANTLNGSGAPIGRTLVAILENYQQADAVLRVPEVLRLLWLGLADH